MESIEGILPDYLVVHEVNAVCCGGVLGGLGVFDVLEVVVFYSKDILDEWQVSPGVVHHCVQVIKTIKQYQYASLRCVMLCIGGCAILCMVLGVEIHEFLADLETQLVIVLQSQDWWWYPKRLEQTEQAICDVIYSFRDHNSSLTAFFPWLNSQGFKVAFSAWKDKEIW